MVPVREYGMHVCVCVREVDGDYGLTVDIHMTNQFQSTVVKLQSE